MPALRQSLKPYKFRITLIAAVALAAAAIFDWTRPPQEQKSLYLFEHFLVGPYRLVVRPVTARFVRCRFRPTCSAYAVEAVKVHGFPKGMWLSAKRLGRCMPWVPLGTVDPVPRKTKTSRRDSRGGR